MTKICFLMICLKADLFLSIEQLKNEYEIWAKMDGCSFKSKLFSPPFHV